MVVMISGVSLSLLISGTRGSVINRPAFLRKSWNFDTSLSFQITWRSRCSNRSTCRLTFSQLYFSAVASPLSAIASLIACRVSSFNKASARERGLSRLRQQTLLAVREHAGIARYIGRYYRCAAGHGLQQDDAEALPPGGRGTEYVCCAVVRGKLGEGDVMRENCAVAQQGFGHRLVLEAQPEAGAGDDQSEIGEILLYEGACLDQVAYALAFLQPSHKKYIELVVFKLGSQRPVRLIVMDIHAVGDDAVVGWQDILICSLEPVLKRRFFRAALHRVYAWWDGSASICSSVRGTHGTCPR